jgi:hypothetical protein
MKLIWRGKFINEKQLIAGDLPYNAIRFKEPETPAMINLIASLFIIPVIIVIAIAVYIKTLLGTNINFFDMFNLWGIGLALLVIFPHEFLHAICFPKRAEVQVWYSLKNMMAFVFSTCPTSKLRFIFLCLLPNIIFGLIPLIAWIFIPLEFTVISKTVLTFASFSLSMGIGDFLNVYNATIQMPKNSVTQLSGFHSYWYMEREQ